jgi:hypothetical protein
MTEELDGASRGQGNDPPADRSGNKADHLQWRVALFAAGAAMGLGGMFLDSRPVIWAAIGILGIGFLLRFFGRP